MSKEQCDKLSSLIIEQLPKDNREILMGTIADTYIEEGIENSIFIGIKKGIEKGK